MRPGVSWGVLGYPWVSWGILGCPGVIRPTPFSECITADSFTGGYQLPLQTVIPVAVPNEYGLGVKRVLTHGNPIYCFKMTINGILECVEALCRNYVIRQIIPGIYNSVAVEILTKV